MSTHAPGPWAIIPRLSPEGDIATVYGTTEGWVSIHAPGWSNIGDRKVAMANARLIAAAPELLEALKRLMGGTSTLQDAMEANQQARAAIAKATGGEE
jgi:hypothetical protein